MPLVSIIVPVYNVEMYLDRCMQSLLHQTLTDIEIILVDDGSPDGCPALCDAYMDKDARVKVVHKKNAGLGLARNSGLEIATGEYVAFVDSDDFVELDMYEKLLAEADRYGADVVFSNAIFDKDGECNVRMDVGMTLIASTKEEIEAYLLDYVAPLPEDNHDVKYMMSVWRAIYRRKVLTDNDISFLSERMVVSEDMPFNIDFMAHSNVIVHTDKAYYHYCLNPASLTANHSIAKNDKRVYWLSLIREQLLKYYPEEDVMLHWERLVLFVLRQLVQHERMICANDKAWREQVERRLSQSPFREVLDSYPIGRMPLKFKLFNYLLKYRFISILKHLS